MLVTSCKPVCRQRQARASRGNPNQDASLYGYGKKGAPEKPTDCSGLVENCIVAGDESNPRTTQTDVSGVKRIKSASTKVNSNDDIQTGNAVVIDWGGNGGDGHAGLLTGIIENDDGTITYEVTHASFSRGPVTDTFDKGDDRLSGFYKWDTKPDYAKQPNRQVSSRTHTWVRKPAFKILGITFNKLTLQKK